MEGYCSTGQSPQWAVVPMEEEEEGGGGGRGSGGGGGGGGGLRNIVLSILPGKIFSCHIFFALI